MARGLDDYKVERARAMGVMIYTATGSGWDLIGEELRANDREDASGARRCVADHFANDRISAAAQTLGCTDERAAEIRKLLVTIWGEPK